MKGKRSTKILSRTFEPAVPGNVKIRLPNDNLLKRVPRVSCNLKLNRRKEFYIFITVVCCCNLQRNFTNTAMLS
jgi:hypothetical protein